MKREDYTRSLRGIFRKSGVTSSYLDAGVFERAFSIVAGDLVAKDSEINYLKSQLEALNRKLSTAPKPRKTRVTGKRGREQVHPYGHEYWLAWAIKINFCKPADWSVDKYLAVQKVDINGDTMTRQRRTHIKGALSKQAPDAFKQMRSNYKEFGYPVGLGVSITAPENPENPDAAVLSAFLKSLRK